jgi:hypothetical protein
MAKFKIGQKVICDPDFTTLSDELKKQWFIVFSDQDNERLIIGESYQIEDIDVHFPGKICVKLKGPYYFHSEFVPEEFFTDDKKIIRDKKIDLILK